MNDIRSDGDGDASRDRREQLSALMDGELDADAAAGCCELWRERPDARASWHLYHVIGDVLRADAQVACDAARDARLLQAVRQRLAAEPPARSPGPPRRRLSDGAAGLVRRASPLVPAAPRRRAGWLAGAAAAAFATAAGFLVITQGESGPVSPLAGPMLAGATRPAPMPAQGMQLATAAPADAAAVPPPTEPADVQLIRDARLDQYLAAHTQFGGSSALGVPSGFLRSSTLQAPGR